MDIKEETSAAKKLGAEKALELAKRAGYGTVISHRSQAKERVKLHSGPARVRGGAAAAPGCSTSTRRAPGRARTAPGASRPCGLSAWRGDPWRR